VNKRKDRKDSYRRTGIEKERGIRRNITKVTKTGKKGISTWREGSAIEQNILKIANGFTRMRCTQRRRVECRSEKRS